MLRALDRGLPSAALFRICGASTVVTQREHGRLVALNKAGKKLITQSGPPSRSAAAQAGTDAYPTDSFTAPDGRGSEGDVGLFRPLALAVAELFVPVLDHMDRRRFCFLTRRRVQQHEASIG